jgi:UDP-N-acetylmuramoyl-tripeptide--D-alanyl-D-alanine ligase
MIVLSSEEASRALGVERMAEAVPRVSTDTRTLLPGDLFVALVGERYDGHAFVPAAFAAGAAGAVVEMGRSIAGDPLWQPPAGPGRLHAVPDTLRALGALARAVRRKSGATVIAVTGSVGKTGTKDLIKAMAGRVCPVVATNANLNNDVGVPLTLFELGANTRVAVVEMGMRGRGEIRALAEVAEPDVGLITKLAPVHLESLGTLEEVARAKSELLEALRPEGRAVIPAGEPLLEHHAASSKRHVVRFQLLDQAARSSHSIPTADVVGRLLARDSRRGSSLLLSWPGGEVRLRLPYLPRHRFENIVAAAAACFAADLPLEECLEGTGEADFSPGRGDEIRVGGLLLLDDSYNANPVSMHASLDWLVERARAEERRPVAVLGDMLELGAKSETYHREVGEYAASAGVEMLWSFGSYAQAMVDGFDSAARLDGGRLDFRSIAGDASDIESNLKSITLDLSPTDAVLVKGSRALRLERVVLAVSRAFGAESAGPKGG